MKRVLTAFVLLASTCFAYGQQEVVTMTSTGTYRAHSTAPAHINMYLVRDYPAATNVSWYTNDDMWKATIIENGSLTHVYYNNAGESHIAVLPVRITSVPDNILMAAARMYGDKLYSISTMKGLQNQPVYHVHLLEDQERHSRWLNDNGVEIEAQYLPRKE